MAISFKVPKSPTKQVYESTNFLGADFTSEASTVDDTKSPNCENMIRSVPGKIRKRMGYKEVADYKAPIYGIHYYSITNSWFIHAGNKLFDTRSWRGGKWGAPSSQGQAFSWTKTVIVSDFSEAGLAEKANAYLADEENAKPYPVHEGYVPSGRSTGTYTFRVVRSWSDVWDTQHYEYEVTYTWTNTYKALDYIYDKTNEEEIVPTDPEEGVEVDPETGDPVNTESVGENNIWLLDGNTDNQLIYEGMAEHRSTSFELSGKLIILDGTSIKYVDPEGVHLLTDVAYVPTLTISKNPKGGGTDYEPLNLIQPAFIERFYVAASSTQNNYNPSSIKKFQLSFGELDATTVKAWVMNSSGDWIEKTEGTHFTVNRTTGEVTFTTAPGAAPLEGEDNVKIQAYKTFEGYADRINHCTIGAMFGVNGAHDRIFISGNPDSGVNEDGDAYTYINCDWFSGQYDPTYWGDTHYSKLGADNSAIMGYSIVNNYLAAHKDTREVRQSILIREGDLVEDQPVFKLINTLQGAGAISKYCFSYLETEPVFLTGLGVYAVTAQDVTGEKYAQDRSYYLEGKLLKEEGLENAHAFSWKDYYCVSVNNHLYVLDGLQPMQTDRSRPYATRQYAGFYFTNIPASCFADIDGVLYFGSNDGHLYRFYTDEKALGSYNDNGEPIHAVWETADISEKMFYKKKTYRYMALRCLPEISSSVKIYAQKDGIWNLLKEDLVALKYFSYANLIYSKLTYSTNKTQKVSPSKIRLKKLDHVRFKFENDNLNEPLGINDFAVEYTQAGNVK